MYVGHAGVEPPSAMKKMFRRRHWDAMDLEGGSTVLEEEAGSTDGEDACDQEQQPGSPQRNSMTVIEDAFDGDPMHWKPASTMSPGGLLRWAKSPLLCALPRPPP